MSILNNPMWTKLAEREKRLVVGLGLFLIVVVLYSLIWAPIQKDFSAVGSLSSDSLPDGIKDMQSGNPEPKKYLTENGLNFRTNSSSITH